MPHDTGTHAACSIEHAVRHEPRRRRRDGDDRRVRAVRHQRRHAVAGLAVRDLGADLAHDAGAVVADDVRLATQVAARAVQHVAALDGDRLHVDEHAAWGAAAGRAPPRT